MGRKQKDYHFIYKTTCMINNKFYVGMHSTNNLEDGYIGSGKRLWYSIKKYGRENFKCEILEYYPNREELVKREKELVNEDILKDRLCLNIGLGGIGGSSMLTKEQLSLGGKNGNISLQNKINSDPIFKETFSKMLSLKNKKLWCNSDYRQKVLKNLDWNGKKHTEETKKKISDLRKGTGIGSSNSQFGSCWITNEKENKKIKKGDLIPDGWRLGRVTNN